MNTDKLTRIEVIDHRAETDTPGRMVSLWDSKMKVELSFQDDERTLKIFITSQTQSENIDKFGS